MSIVAGFFELCIEMCSCENRETTCTYHTYTPEASCQQQFSSSCMRNKRNRFGKKGGMLKDMNLTKRHIQRLLLDLYVPNIYNQPRFLIYNNMKGRSIANGQVLSVLKEREEKAFKTCPHRHTTMIYMAEDESYREQHSSPESDPSSVCLELVQLP